MSDAKTWKVQPLPLAVDFETRKVLKSLPAAHAALAELKGIARSIPNQAILINTLGLQEAKDSSAIENIITTHDELYKSGIQLESTQSMQAKEVQNYISAMKKGFALCSQKGILSSRIILEIQEELEQNKAGYRKLPGTNLKNASTGEVIYTPPQEYDEIVALMSNLENFINDPEIADYDALVKMAIIHFQFESIHPFYDGNGRTGRIINILYLILSGLLEMPILYLSRYIIQHKADYYKLLQAVRETQNWEDWLLFMIKGVEETAKENIVLISEMDKLMENYKHQIREKYKFYSHDLLNSLFKHPYTKIDFLVADLGITRITATSYLNKLSEDGLLKKEKIGNAYYFVNVPLFNLLSSK